MSHCLGVTVCVPGRHQLRLFAAVCVLWPVLNPAVGADELAREARTILSDRCFHCHGPDARTRRADLRLDTAEGIQSVVDADAPNDSELLRRISSHDVDERMPPADSKLTLNQQQIELLRRWVTAGAKWQGHWAFQSVVRPQPPADSSGWSRTGIDAFVRQRLLTAGLQPLSRAGKEKLLRRVTFDLTGLPPTTEELDEFLADSAPSAFEKVLDRLFASPRYGERMAWEWLEAARYADTNGFQGDPERTMWPWRDWVVDALNANMPFDQFTIEQLAGDMLPEATLSQKIASGFNRNHMFNGEGGRIPDETRVENVFDRTETTATVWMGLTMTCCRCHDHKYDPFSQREYYGLYAFFNNTSETGRPGGRRGQIPPVVQAPTREQQQRLQRLDVTLKAQARDVLAFESAQKLAESDLPDEIRGLLRKNPSGRGVAGMDKLLNRFKDQTEYVALLRPLRKTLQTRDSVFSAVARVMVMDDLPEPRETFVLTRGVYNNPGAKVQAHLPSVLPSVEVRRPDRLQLAKWLTDASHPLTARVTVNRYWQLFFGTGLVSTPENFGVQGERPSHPELLDYLAAEFSGGNWDVKGIQRAIVSSATYCQSAVVAKQHRSRLESDPANRLLSRGPRHRQSAAMVRDSALFVSGLLIDTVGGPPVKPYQPPGVWAAATFGNKKYVPDTGSRLYRRSVYTFWRRIIGPTMFFDSARRQTCEVRTTRTNTPLHALLTLNDVTWVEAARHLAARAMRRSDDRTQQLRMIFRAATSRTAKPRELLMLSDRLTRFRMHYADADAAAQELLATGASPVDESLPHAEHAALTSVALLILNLDEALSH